MHSNTAWPQRSAGMVPLLPGGTVKKKTIIMIAAVLAVAASLILVRMAENRDTEDLLSRVDRFSVPPGWAQEDDVVRPVRYLCFDTNPCPSIYRSWNAGKEIAPTDLAAMVSKSGFEMKVDGSCTRKPRDIGPTTVCSSSGNDGQYQYLLNVRSPGPGQPDLIILNVSPQQ